jgi:hypothetical protein
MLQIVSNSCSEFVERRLDVHKGMWEPDFGTIHSAIAGSFEHSKYRCISWIEYDIVYHFLFPRISENLPCFVYRKRTLRTSRFDIAPTWTSVTQSMEVLESAEALKDTRCYR